MVASLARLARVVPDGVRVLPGHGPETTMERERAWIKGVAETGRLALG
jgi:glyoxylase-like metal-dependent hydrolase (beta-lactamase superfamily II)